MSVSYRPVQWNRSKLVYDAVLVVAVAVYIIFYIELSPMLLTQEAAASTPIVRMRAFGSAAFLMLTVILAIGPLARLDTRFLPLLYNRRHFGVLFFLVAFTHMREVAGFYHAFSPANKWASLLSTNSAVETVAGFPIEWLGLAALLIFFLMAVTSHDFWLAFLGPRAWKTLHMGVYVGYALVVAHVVLGAVQDEGGLLLAAVVAGAAALLIALHLAAGLKERRHERAEASAAAEAPWRVAGRIADFRPGRGHVVVLPDAERVAIFRHGDAGEKLSALSNVCAHQNGPLGEGRVIDGCVTCPWHGFQYRPEDGCAPPPFTEKVPTYRLRLDGDRVLLDPRPLPPGTPVDPVIIAPA